MKIGVIADTHVVGPGFSARNLATRLVNQVSGGAEELAVLVRPYFAGVDLIIHAGDFVCRDVVTALSQFAPVQGVAGNSDRAEIASLFPAKTVVLAEGLHIGVVHGWGAPHGLEQRVRREFIGLDAIVFGHSHLPFAGKVDGTLMFNPGSPTDKRFAPTHSLGILHIEDGHIRPELIPLP